MRIPESAFCCSLQGIDTPAKHPEHHSLSGQKWHVFWWQPEAKERQTCIECHDSLIQLIAPWAALLDEGLDVVPGLAAVGLHAPALLMGHGQGMRRSPVAGIMGIQVMLVS